MGLFVCFCLFSCYGHRILQWGEGVRTNIISGQCNAILMAFLWGSLSPHPPPLPPNHLALRMTRTGSKNYQVFVLFCTRSEFCVCVHVKRRAISSLDLHCVCIRRIYSFATQKMETPKISSGNIWMTRGNRKRSDLQNKNIFPLPKKAFTLPKQQLANSILTLLIATMCT